MRFLLLLLGLLPWAAAAGQMTEIVYEDTEPDQAPYTSRILIDGDRMRMDYGRDDDDFVVYDRRAGHIYQVTRSAARIVVIPVRRAGLELPRDWKLSVSTDPGGGNRSTRVELQGKVCVEVKSADLLPREAALIRDFFRGLSGIQATTWQATPEELRDPCTLALDVVKAGIEYDAGLPLVIRYADGRSRVYRSHARRAATARLFELPAGYRRFKIGQDASR